MAIEELLKKRRQIRQFSTTDLPSKTLIQDLIKKAYDITPSKQNFYPYQVFVIGPEDHKDREKFLNIIQKHPGGSDNINAWSAPYILLFCGRFIEEHPDPVIKERIKRGMFYEQMSPTMFGGYQPQIALEIGMFAMNLTSLCMENNVDVSYQLCLPDYDKTKSEWEKLSFMKTLYIIEKTLFCMQLGYEHKNARKNVSEIKPNVHEVVKFI